MPALQNEVDATPGRESREGQCHALAQLTGPSERVPLMATTRMTAIGRRVEATPTGHRSTITRIVSSDAKATASVVSDVLLPHEPQLVQRGHRQRGRPQVHLLRRR